MLPRFLFVLFTLAFASSAGAEEPQLELSHRQTLFEGGREGYAAYRIPVLLESPGGVLIAFCEARKNGTADYGDIDLVARRSDDGGRTWQPRQLVHEVGGTESVTIGNPCPIAIPARGDEPARVHLLFTQDNRRLFSCDSLDEGRTWSEPVEHPNAVPQLRDQSGYDIVRIATGPVKGLRLASGRLVAPIWVSQFPLDDLPGKTDRYRCGSIVSDDGGRTWQAGGLVAPALLDLNECTVCRMDTQPDSWLLLNARSRIAGSRTLSFSTDHGRTWEDPQLLATLPDCVCQGEMIRLPDGRLLFSNPHTRIGDGSFSERRRRLGLSVSDDSGRTWRQVGLIEPGPSAYSSLVLLEDEADPLAMLFECGTERYNQRIDFARLAVPADEPGQ